MGPGDKVPLSTYSPTTTPTTSSINKYKQIIINSDNQNEEEEIEIDDIHAIPSSPMYTALDQGFRLKRQPSRRSLRRLFITTIIIFILLIVTVQLFSSLAANFTSTSRDNNVANYDLSANTCSIPNESGSFPITPRHAIVIDAGSSGSRIHIYQFQYCNYKKLILLESEYFEEVKPGLSSWDTPELAAKSLQSLLDKAVDKIPSVLHKCTPIAVKATAGLRLLSEIKANAIMEYIKSLLIKKYPFSLDSSAEGESVGIIDGSEEGIGAWKTINFLNNNFGNNNGGGEKTSLVIDLGGGSIQIVFQVTTEDNDGSTANLNLSDEKYYSQVKYESKIYTVYQNSYLGYGLNEARKRILSTFMSQRSPDTIQFPCWLKNYSQNENGINLVGSAENANECRSIILNIFDFEARCDIEPCSFNGIHQPAISPEIEIYGLSFIYDRIKPFLVQHSNENENNSNGTGSKELSFTLLEAEVIAQEICQRTFDPKKSDPNPFICLDLNYIIVLLKDGLKIHPTKPIYLAKKINGYETSWSLGSAITILNEQPLCKI